LRDTRLKRSIAALTSALTCWLIVGTSLADNAFPGNDCGKDTTNNARATTKPPPKGSLSFKRFADDRRSYPDSTTVINGQEVKDPTQWPALMRAAFAYPDGSLANCTATMVGPNVVLTAAHCADARKSHGEVRAGFLNIGGVFIPMTCRMHPKYAASPLNADPLLPRSSADYALCVIHEDLSANPAINTTQYEDIDTVTSLIAHAAILVTGDGCASITVQGNKLIPGPYDFKLRIGNADVWAPVSLSGDDADYIIAHSTLTDRAALCPGDSGGPLVTGATQAQPTVSRHVVAVNSSITLSDTDRSIYESRFAALATDDFRSFLKCWVKEQGNPTVCGFNEHAGRWPCRQ